MTICFKLLLAGVVAIVALSAATASAAEIGIANGGAVNAVTSGKATFTAGTATIACNLTLGLEISRGPIAKAPGARFGFVRSVTWRECQGGEIRTVLGTPWEIVYSSISGTLPSGVTSIKFFILNSQWQFSTFFGLVDCLYAGALGILIGLALIRGTTERYTTGAGTFDETSVLSYASGPESCPSQGSWRGTFNLSATQTLTRT